MKRRLAFLLTVAMSFGLVTGCGSQSDEKVADNAVGNADTADVAEAAVEIDFDEEPYEATLMYWAANDAQGLAAVEEAFNELTLSQLNIKVKLMPMTFGTYAQQIQMILSSDDDLDIFPFYGTNIGTYVDAEYVVDMSEYLETYGQDMIDIIGMEDIECCYLDDFLAGVPNMHERTAPVTFVMRTDILEETGFSAEDIKTAEDLTPVFAAVHELYPNMIVYGGSSGMAYPVIMDAVMDPLGGAKFGVLMDYGQTTTVSNFYESETFKNACLLVREWHEAGYTSADFATCTDFGESLMRAGNLFCYTCNGKPDTKAEKDAQTGYDTTCIPVVDNACYTYVTNSIMYGISSNSKDPEKAMMLLNWIYATKEANDLLNWGIEGTDYVVTEDGTIDYPEGVSAENVAYHMGYGWALPNQYNSYIWAGNSLDVWEQYQAVRDNATVSKAYGFCFDSTPVLNELSALTAVSDEYLKSIGTGSVDTETALAEFNEKLYAAGLQVVMDEKQAQLDAWLAEQ